MPVAELPNGIVLNDGETAIGPQPGPQTQFVASRASIVGYGGAASGG